MRRLLLLAALPFLAACGGSHALEGTWIQDLPGGERGIDMKFQIGGDQMLVHDVPPSDGGHAPHIEGCTYTYDDATKALTIQGELFGAGKGDKWTGKVAGSQIDLSAPDGKTKFHRGEAAHGH